MTSAPWSRHAAGGRHLETGDHPQRRRLAGARWAEHREELAVADVEVDAGDGDDVAISLHDRLEPDGDGRLRCDVRRAGGLGRDRQSGTSEASATRPSGVAVTRVRRTVQRPSERVKPQPTVFRSARHRLRAVSSSPTRTRASASFAIALLGALIAAACEAGPPPPTPTIMPGTSTAPREVNLIAKDYTFLPDAVDLAPGETVLLHIINGGLEVHEAVIGDAAVQDAWELAEAATAGAPPGPTPLVQVPPDVAGLRVVVRSGQRVDLVWTVPADAARSATPWVVGCHIPGHWARGMQVPIRWVAAADR